MKQRTETSCRAFTLVELCLGLVVTSLVMSALSVVMLTVGRFWEQGTQLDKNGSAMMQLTARLQNALQDAKIVGQWKLGNSGESAGIVYWLRDANDDGQIETSELTVIRFNPATNAIELVGASPSPVSGGSSGTGGSGGVVGGGVVGGGVVGGGVVGGGVVTGSGGTVSGGADATWTLSELRAADAISRVEAGQTAKRMLANVSSAHLEVSHLDETTVAPIVTWTVELENDPGGIRQPITTSLRAAVQ